MSLWNIAGYFLGQKPPEPAPPPQQDIQVPQFIKDNMYLTISGGLSLIRGPKTLAFGAITALFFKMVQSGSIASQHKPLIERFIEVIQPVLDQPLTVADMVAFSALLMFDDFAPVTSWWIGLTATLIVLNKSRQD